MAYINRQLGDELPIVPVHENLMVYELKLLIVSLEREALDVADPSAFAAQRNDEIRHDFCRNFQENVKIYRGKIISRWTAPKWS
jgi:hypothetical protein